MKAAAGARFAVIADIHGNADALAAVLADIDAQGIGTILNLGDHFSGPLAAAETAEMLLARGDMVSIRGNHDRYLLETPAGHMGASDAAAHAQLEPRHLDWLRALPASARLGDVLLCHGTPDDDETYLLDEVGPAGIGPRDAAGIAGLIDGTGAQVILCAHSHLPRAVRLPGGPLVVNPGSVGCPGYVDDEPVPHLVETRLPDASYAVLDRAGGDWRVSFHLVPYDTGRMVGLARAAGRAEWAQALATGWLTAGA